MASNWELSVLDDRIWFVGAHTIYGEPKHYAGESAKERAEVILPICQLDGLTAEEVGRTVLELVPVARACFAAHLASAYDSPDDQDYYKRAADETVEDMILVELPYLERYVGNEYVNQTSLCSAIDFLRTLRDRYHQRLLSKRLPSRSAHPARRAISKDYNGIFVRLGRRDGFHCAACSTTSNLQIDHIKPVSLGGSSEDDNLQLLCAPCNNRKSDRTIDYRKASPNAAQPQDESNLYTQQPPVTSNMPGVGNGNRP